LKAFVSKTRVMGKGCTWGSGRFSPPRLQGTKKLDEEYVILSGCEGSLWDLDHPATREHELPAEPIEILRLRLRMTDIT